MATLLFGWRSRCLLCRLSERSSAPGLRRSEEQENSASAYNRSQGYGPRMNGIRKGHRDHQSKNSEHGCAYRKLTPPGENGEDEGDGATGGKQSPDVMRCHGNSLNRIGPLKREQSPCREDGNGDDGDG
jgi:hypothetical protein